MTTGAEQGIDVRTRCAVSDKCGSSDRHTSEALAGVGERSLTWARCQDTEAIRRKAGTLTPFFPPRKIKVSTVDSYTATLSSAGATICPDCGVAWVVPALVCWGRMAYGRPWQSCMRMSSMAVEIFGHALTIERRCRTPVALWCR
jgi:hypothetical protein